MLRPFCVAASLICLVSASHPPLPQADRGAADVSNIGFVLYTRSPAPGTLNARWIYAGTYSGPGIATGGPRDGYAGKYHVRYFHDSGEFSDEYDLVIEKTKDVYKASWISKGEVAAVGVGMEVENGLAIGWRRVAD